MRGIFSKLSFCSKVPLVSLCRRMETERSRIRSNDFSPSSLYQLDRALEVSPSRFTVADLVQMKVGSF